MPLLPFEDEFGSSASLVLFSSINIMQKMLDKYFNNSMNLLLFTCKKAHEYEILEV